MPLSDGPSDSDSEMETRLKEAAVSVKDLLPSLSLSAPSAEPPCSDKVKEEKKAAEEEESVVKKRKKKRRKQSEGERDSAGSLNAQSNDEHRSSEQEHMLTKKKKKKKQQQDGNTEEEALNWSLCSFIMGCLSVSQPVTSLKWLNGDESSKTFECIWGNMQQTQHS